MSPYPTFGKSILIPFFRLNLGLPSGLFLSGFPTKIPYAPLLCSLRSTNHVYLIPLDLIHQITFGVKHTSYSASLYSLLHSPYSLEPLGAKYLTQKAILENPHPTFLPQCDRSSYIVTLRCLLTLKPGSSVGIATDYRLDGPRSNPSGDEIFRPSRPTLGFTQPPVKWVPGLSRG